MPRRVMGVEVGVELAVRDRRREAHDQLILDDADGAHGEGLDRALYIENNAIAGCEARRGSQGLGIRRRNRPIPLPQRRREPGRRQEPQPVEPRIRLHRRDRLELLRLLALTRNALHARAGGDQGGRTGIERERDLRGGCRTRPQLIVDQPNQAQHRVAQCRGAQERLVGGALVVKREHVRDRRPQLDRGDGIVVADARREVGELGRV